MTAAFRNLLASLRAEQPPTDDAPLNEHGRYLLAQVLLVMLSPAFLLLWVAAVIVTAAWELFW